MPVRDRIDSEVSRGLEAFFEKAGDEPLPGNDTLRLGGRLTKPQVAVGPGSEPTNGAAP
jgi:hypothetical protein